MKQAHFEGEVVSGHKGAAVRVPFDPAERWGIKSISIVPGRRGHEVKGTLAGTPIQSYVVARSRRFWLMVNADCLHTAGVTIGETVAIRLEPA
jgi:Domain of unknown function (DUF1905)